MRYFLFSVILIISQATLGQTGKHIAVPGTQCSIVPPRGFTVATNFNGLQDIKTGASIMITEMPAPYQELVNGFTADALKTRGMTLISKQEIDFNNSKASLLAITQPANGMIYEKQLLIFGDVNKTILVNGIYPQTSKGMEAEMKEALLTTIYNVEQNDDPMSSVPFIINVEGTPFKFANNMAGSLLYTTTGTVPSNGPILVAGSSLGAVNAQNRKQYAEERFRKLPDGQSAIIKSTTEVVIDSMQGYEIVAEGKDHQGRKQLIYQVMLFNDRGDYFMILGQSSDDIENYLNIYKKIAQTFELK